MIKLSKSDIGIPEIIAVFKVLKKAYLGRGSEVKYLRIILKRFLKEK